MTVPWAETTLLIILSRISLENILNADKFGLFYQCLPNKTLQLKGGKCSGGKHSKVRLTGLAAGNAYGERLQMFVIGKSVTPRYFKDVNPLSTNPTKWWNTLKQFVGNLPSNCLSVFDHFVKLTLKGLKWYCVQHKSWMSGELFEDWVHELDRKFPYLRQR